MKISNFQFPIKFQILDFFYTSLVSCLLSLIFTLFLFLPSSARAENCGSDPDCRTPLTYCSGGLCVNKLANGSACGRSGECAGGACFGGSCAEYCGDDSRCSNGAQYCRADVCQDKIADGGACDGDIQCSSGKCLVDTCGSGCVLNSDCPDGFRCNADRICEAGAAPKRVGEACEAPAECASGRCSSGVCRCNGDANCLVGEYCSPQSNCEAKKSGGESCNENLECFSGVCTGRPKKCADEGGLRRSASCCLCRDGSSLTLLPDEGAEMCTTKCGDAGFGSISSDPDLCGAAILPPPPEGAAGESTGNGEGGGRSIFPRLIPEACTRSGSGSCGLPELVQVGINLARIILAMSGSLALLMFIYGGFKWLTAAGSAERVDEGKKILTGAVIGLIIIFGAATIINFASNALTGTQSGQQAKCEDLSVPGVSSYECSELSEAEFQTKIDKGECVQGYCPGSRLNVCCKGPPKE